MIRTELVINVHGGIVQDIFCSDIDADIILVDWDCQPDDDGIVEIKHGSRTKRALVARPNPLPLQRLAGSDVEAAIESAEHAGVLPQPAY